MTPNELVDKFKSETSLVKGGTLIFWDMSFGKHGDNFYKIESIEAIENKIIIKTSYPKIEIWNAKEIIEHKAKNDFWPPQLEFCNPTRMRLEYIFHDKSFFADFHFQDNKLTTETNSDLFNNGTREIKGDNLNVIIFE
ncbi:MAG: hypothetical protein ACK50A_04450 [Sphingobacteriaceae bacterium]|jgi:hypothetical protein